MRFQHRQTGVLRSDGMASNNSACRDCRASLLNAYSRGRGGQRGKPFLPMETLSSTPKVFRQTRLALSSHRPPYRLGQRPVTQPVCSTSLGVACAPFSWTKSTRSAAFAAAALCEGHSLYLILPPLGWVPAASAGYASLGAGCHQGGAIQTPRWYALCGPVFSLKTKTPYWGMFADCSRANSVLTRELLWI